MVAAQDPARVVVVGGGIVGLWTAVLLLQRGHRVTVVERAEAGEGATAKMTGGIRSQFSNPVNIGLSLRSLELWDGFADLTGAALQVRRHGYLFLHDDRVVLEQIERGLVVLRDAGVPALLLEPGEIEPHFPGVRTDGLVGATFTPDDGSASPADAVLGLLAAARRLGGEVHRHTEFLELLTRADGTVRGVRTSEGEVAADHVVLATGPQARASGSRCGLHVPVAATPRQAFAVRSRRPLRPDLPLAIDMASGAYVHADGPHSAVIGGHDRENAENQPDDDTAGVDWDRLEALAVALTHRFPELDDLEVGNGWAGLREMTPDDVPIVGPAPGVPGLWLAVGFSGHGFSQAPAAAEVVVDLMHGRPPRVDPAPLGLERFDHAVAAAESAVF